MCLCPRTNTGLYCESPSETSTSSSAAASCTLQCANGGDCKLGTRSDSELADAYRFWHSDSGDTDTSSSGSISNKNMYCQCTESWDGPECLVAKVPCGTNHCFHGSECLTRSEGGKTVHRCDCAVIADGDFAGQFCQYPATSQCAAADEARGIPALFCVNQGQCQAQAANAYQGCICSTDFTGFSCEFRTNAVLTTPTTNNNNTATTSPQQPVVYNSTSESDQDVHEIDENENFGRPLMDDPNAVACNVECQNEGTCRHGQKEPDEAWDTATKNTTHLTSSTTTIIKTETEEFAHCVCPDNFAGNYCEHPVDECGAANGKFLCLHGSKCVNVGEEQLCDCDVADSNLATFFAGAHCQHPVDDICTTKGTTNGNGVTTTSSVTFFGNAIPGTSMAFCVNGGKCKEYVAPTNPYVFSRFTS